VGNEDDSMWNYAQRNSFSEATARDKWLFGASRFRSSFIHSMFEGFWASFCRVLRLRLVSPFGPLTVKQRRNFASEVGGGKGGIESLAALEGGFAVTQLTI
jgi:hypothetical protein